MIEKVAGIYKLTFPNNKVYIGQSINLEKRLREHYNESRYLRGNMVVHKAIAKYGWDYIQKDVIITLPIYNQVQLDGYEKFWINVHQSRDRKLGYNIAPGGLGGGCGLSGVNHPNFGKPRSEESKLKQSISAKKFWENNVEGREQVRNRMLGKQYSLGLKLSKETIEKIALNNPRKRKILQYSKDGNFIREWETMQEAANFYKVNATSILRALNNCNLSICNFVWNDFKTNYPLTITQYKRNTKKSYKYWQLDNDKNKIKLWESSDNILEFFNKKSMSSLHEAVRENHRFSGFYWERDNS